MKDSRKLFKRLGFVGIALCGACCLLPVVGVMLGMGALSFLTGFLEWAGMISIAAAMVFFAIYFFRSRRATACDVNCACKDEKQVTSSAKTEKQDA